MTKPNLTPPCRNCGELFRKPHKRAVFCSPRCAVLHKTAIKGSGECWLWFGARKPNGYGSMGMNGQAFYPHRLMLEAKVGHSLPSSIDTCHSCDNRLCVNPEHLFAGTRTDNMRDAAAKGRVVAAPPRKRGTEHGQAKLTDDAVLAIRQSAERKSDLARRFGVTAGVIRDVLSRKTWRHL